jgi:hypothetical protein
MGMFRKICAAFVAVAVAMTGFPASADFMFRYRDTFKPAPVPEEPVFGEGNDIVAWFVAPVGYPFLKDIPVATHDVTKWVKDSGKTPAGINVETSTGAISGEAQAVEKTNTTWYGLDASGGRIARAQMNFSTFQPVGQVTEVNWYTHTGEYFYSQIPADQGAEVVRWEPLLDNPAGMTTRNGAFEGTPPAAGTFAMAWRGFDYLNREVAFTYGEFLVQDGPVIEHIPDQIADKDLGETFSVAPEVKHKIGTISYVLKPVAARPSGLVFKTTDGSIKGVYEDYDTTAQFYLEARDSGSGRTGESNVFTLTTLPETINLSNIPDISWVVDKWFQQKISSGSDAATFNLVAGSLPSGLTLNNVSGPWGTRAEISGVPKRIEVQDGLQISATGPNVTPVTSNPFKFTVHASGIWFDLGEVHARVGKAFQSAAPVVTSGIEPPYTYEAAPDLPVGIAFDSATGRFSSAGLDEAGFYDHGLTVTNAGGKATKRSQVIRVYNDLTLAYPSATTGNRLSSVSVEPILTADSVRDPARYTLAQGQLPDFLTFNPATGIISGKPTKMEHIGSYGPFVVTLVDGFNEPPLSSNPFTIRIDDRPDLELLQVAGEVQRYVYRSPRVATAKNAVDGATYSITDRGNLPSTLDMNADGFLIGNTTDPVGTVYSFKIAAVDGLGYSDDLDVSMTVVAPGDIGAIGGGLNRTFTWTVGRDFIGFALPEVTNTYGTVTYTLGSSPFALQFDPSTRALSGRSDEVGTFSVDYTVTDDSGRPAAVGHLTFVIQPEMEIVQGDVTANRGMPVSIVPTRTNGVGQFTWTIESGRLPGTGSFAPMVFNPSTGAISGKPREQGTFPLTLKVVDATGEEDTVDFVLTVEPPLPFKFSYGEIWMTYGQFSTAAPSFENRSEEVTWSISGTLPGGVAFFTDPANSGLFRGTPSEDGAFENIVITGTDTGTAETWTEIVTVKVRRDGSVGLTGTSVKERVATSSSEAFAATNVTAPVKYELVDNAYPSEASIDAATGELTTQFAAPGKYVLTIRATDLFGRSKTVTTTYDIVDKLKITAPAMTTAKQYARVSVPLTIENLIGTATVALDGASKPLPPELRVLSSEIAGEPVTVETLDGILVSVTDSHDNAVVSTDPAITIDVVARDQLDLTATDYEQQQYKPVSFTPSIQHAIGTVAYTLAGATLPTGLTFDSSNGSINGTTDDLFDGAFTLTAVDSKGGPLGTDIEHFNLKIGERDKPVITTDSSQLALVDHDYALTLETDKVLGTVTWRLVSGTLPKGVTFDAAAGAFVGKAEEIGSFGPIQIEITDTYKNITTTNTKSFSFGVVQDGTPIALTVPSEVAFRIGETSQAQKPAASNTYGNLEWSAIGIGGTGLSIDPKTGIISGTPTATGSVTVTFTVKDATGRTASATTTLIVKAALKVVFQTESYLTYNYTFAGTTPNSLGKSLPSVSQPEGENSYGTEAWSISPAGGLPRGLSLNAQTGMFAGVPLQIGSFGPFTLTLKDSLPGQATLSNVYLDVKMNDDPIDLTVRDYTTKVGYAITTSNPAVNNNLGDVTFFPENNDLAGTNLVLNPDTGVLTGSFATPQDRDINIAVTDEYTTRVTSRPLSLVVLPLLTLTGPQRAVIEAQAPMSPVIVTPGNVAGELAWDDLATAQKPLLPAGVTFDKSSGRFVGQADEIGVYGPFTVTATDTFHGNKDNGVSNQILLDVRAGALYLNLRASSLADGTKRTAAYSHDFVASNLESFGIDEAGLSWSWVAEQGSKLPPGLTLGSSGKLLGTPTESGKFRFTVTVSGGGKVSSKTFDLTVNLPQIAFDLGASSLADMAAGKAANQFDFKSLLTTTNIPKADVKWALDTAVTLDTTPGVNEKAGLPTGVTFNTATGVLSGTPMEEGNFRFALTASWSETNPTAESASDQEVYALKVTADGYRYYRFNDSASPTGSAAGAAMGATNGVYWGMLKLFTTDGTDVALRGEPSVESYISSPNVWFDQSTSDISRIFDTAVATGMVFGKDAQAVKYVGVKFKYRQKITSYYVSLPKGTDADINWFNTYFPGVPVNFKLEGSQDGVTWVQLHTASFSGNGGASRQQWDATYAVP